MPRRDSSREDRRALYRRRIEDAYGGHYVVSDLALCFFCNRQRDMLACAELDRRARAGKAVGQRPRIAREMQLSARQLHSRKLQEEIEKIKSLPSAKKKKLLAEYRKEREAHPTLAGDIIAQIAKDHLREYAQKHKRKRWKRVPKNKEPEPVSPPTLSEWMKTIDPRQPDPHRRPVDWARLRKL